MIQVHLQEILVSPPKPVNSSSSVLQNLNSFLDKDRFCGKILLTYKLGQLEHVKIEQSYTIDSLIDAMNK